jgi:hypothetical protein
MLVVEDQCGLRLSAIVLPSSSLFVVLQLFFLLKFFGLLISWFSFLLGTILFKKWWKVTCSQIRCNAMKILLFYVTIKLKNWTCFFVFNLLCFSCCSTLYLYFALLPLFDCDARVLFSFLLDECYAYSYLLHKSMARASMHTMVVWTMFPVSFFHGSLSIIICKVASNLDSGRHCFLLGYGKKKLLGMRLSFDFSVSDRWILGLFIYEALGFWQKK